MTSTVRSALLGTLFVLASATAGRAEPQIVWRVENAFRFFTSAASTEMHRATFLALSEEERQHPVLNAERALAERHNGEGWAGTVLDKTCWDAVRNRPVCSGHTDYINPKSHRIIAELKDLDDTLGPECVWLTAPKSGRSRGQAIAVPCNKPITLDIPFPAGAQISVEAGGRQVAETRVQVKDLFIVGVGDSFGSGEGNPDVPVRLSRTRFIDYGKAEGRPAELTGFPARAGDWKEIGDLAFVEANPKWLDQACHRSLYSHQVRAALQLAIEVPDRAVTFVSYACSGAEIINGLFLRYKGHEWVPNPPDLSQISALAQAQCDATPAKDYDLPEAYHMGGKVPSLQGGLVLRKCDPHQARAIDLMLVSIGGNDVGFSRLVANAVLADQSVLRRVGGWIGQVHGFVEANALLNELDDRYKALNRALHSILHIPWGEADRVLTVAYPALTLLEDKKSCPDGRAGMTVVSDFALSESKARDSMVAADRLDHIMQAASRHHGWTYVQQHRAAFIGRSVCAGWSDNALSSADDLRLPRWSGTEWAPYNPANWQPYATRQRWFRTPNDAYLTGNFHVSKSLMQKAVPTNTLSWFQVLLASLYSGAFHPTAEGQAAIADAVVVEARRVLAKYDAKHDGRRVQR